MTVDRDVLAEVRRRIAAGPLVDASLSRWTTSPPLRFLPTVAPGVRRAVRDRLRPPSRTAQDAARSSPQVPPPATPAEIAEVESLIGAPLPDLLRDLYAEANGGFGPGYGLLGLREGSTDDLGRTVLDIVREAQDGSWPGVPPGLVPLCHWGCAVYSFVHCPSGQVYGWDPNPVGPDDDVPFFAQEHDLGSWLLSWLDGTLEQPWLDLGGEPESRLDV